MEIRGAVVAVTWEIAAGHERRVDRDKVDVVSELVQQCWKHNCFVARNQAIVPVICCRKQRTWLTCLYSATKTLAGLQAVPAGDKLTTCVILALPEQFHHLLHPP